MGDISQRQPEYDAWLALFREVLAIAQNPLTPIGVANPIPVQAVIPGVVGVDVIDRAARLLGIIYGDLGQIAQIAAMANAMAPANLLQSASYLSVYNGVTWDMVLEGALPGSIFTDVGDRVGRLLGVAGRNWVLGAGDVPDVSDRAARLLGVVYGNLAQLQQIVALNDALAAPANIVSVAGFNLVFNGVTWERLRGGSAVGSLLSDPLDRWARQLGLVDVSRYLGAACGPLNPIDVQDSGLNTNPRRYEKDNGFRSPVVARAGGVATALWTIATTPVRTAGQDTTIYTIEIENSTGGVVTAWLEIGGVAITVPFHVGDSNTLVIDYPAGLDTGDFDVNCNASVNAVNFSLRGTEA